MITFSELSTEEILQVREKKGTPLMLRNAIRTVHEKMKAMTFDSYEEKRKYFGDEVSAEFDREREKIE